MHKRALGLSLILLCGTACPNESSKDDKATPSPTPAPVNKHNKPRRSVTISIIGTNDLHGHLQRLPILAGYISNLREVRKADGGVVLVDGGDMFQGTLESNLTEGASVVAMYNAMGYTAATIGNHEFDFGPVGDAVTATKPGDDPRGAIKARVKQARFAMLAANIADAVTNQRGSFLPGINTHIVHTVAGVRLGIIGVTTMATPTTTIAANFRGLTMIPLARAILPLAQRLRKDGASAIIVLAHLGGRCRHLKDPNDVSSCGMKQEIFWLARKLPKGSVDVLVAGHTHAGIAHHVNGIAIIESYSKGSAFGRVDLKVDTTTKRVVGVKIFPARWLCKQEPTKTRPCEPGSYEGKPVVVNRAVAALAKRALKRTRVLRERRLGVTLSTRIRRSRAHESPLGNMIADFMRAARPRADVAITNGGGLRADLPKGPLTYGRLYEAQPFDNRFATIKLTVAQLATVLRRNLRRGGGILSVSGIKVKATCDGGKLVVRLFRSDGSALAKTQQLTLVTNDFLASGGDGAFHSLRKKPGVITMEQGETIRDAIAAQLRKRGGTLTARQFYHRDKRRLQLSSQRPMRCR